MASPVNFAPFVILLTSLLAFPMMYVVNAAQTVHGELGLFVSGTACLALVCLLTFVAVRKQNTSGPVDWLFYVFALGTFASAIDVTIGLETDGHVTGLMKVYLKNGEPYLGTPYGALISYWDGTAHYLMYFIMLTAMAYKKNFREVGLYWAGSIGHSMLVLIPGAVVGKFGVRWSFLLNVPYIFIPFISAARFLRERPLVNATTNGSKKGVSVSGTRSFLDVFLIISLILSGAIAVFRGFAVLGCQHGITLDYLKYYEPYLNDPAAFPRVQMLVYLFYFVPFYVFAIDSLRRHEYTILTDWALMFAGAAAQAQVPHLIGSFHSRTAPEYRVPQDATTIFWTINLFLLIAPHLLAVYCYYSRSLKSVISTPLATGKSKKIK